MAASQNRLLSLIRITTQTDLAPVVEAQGWHTVKDLFRKTSTMYNHHWNGVYFLDLDDKPWHAGAEEVAALKRRKGRVVVVLDGKYHSTDGKTIYEDRDGSAYALEDDLTSFLKRVELISDG